MTLKICSSSTNCCNAFPQWLAQIKKKRYNLGIVLWSWWYEIKSWLTFSLVCCAQICIAILTELCQNSSSFRESCKCNLWYEYISCTKLIARGITTFTPTSIILTNTIFSYYSMFFLSYALKTVKRKCFDNNRRVQIAFLALFDTASFRTGLSRSSFWWGGYFDSFDTAGVWAVKKDIKVHETQGVAEKFCAGRISVTRVEKSDALPACN